MNRVRKEKENTYMDVKKVYIYHLLVEIVLVWRASEKIVS